MVVKYFRKVQDSAQRATTSRHRHTDRRQTTDGFATTIAERNVVTFG